jgi:hypothetical protein
MATETTHIIIKKADHPTFKKAAERYSCSMGDIAAASLNFVLVNRYNPFDLTDTAVVEEVRKMKDQLVAYIKKQEQTLLKPLSSEVKSLNRTAGELVTAIQTQLPAPQAVSVPEPVTETIPKPTASPLQVALEDKNRTIERLMKDREELKSRIRVKNGMIFIDLPESRINELLD